MSSVGVAEGLDQLSHVVRVLSMASRGVCRRVGYHGTTWASMFDKHTCCMNLAIGIVFLRAECENALVGIGALGMTFVRIFDFGVSVGVG
jgi:hypothetical protein